MLTKTKAAIAAIVVLTSASGALAQAPGDMFPNHYPADWFIPGRNWPGAGGYAYQQQGDELSVPALHAHKSVHHRHHQ